MLQKMIDGYCQLLSYLIAAALALMVVLVFGNVVLRYAFNSGISVSEELSRWLFVWVTFMGAVVALKDNAHLGTDMLVSRLPATAKRVCLGLALALSLLCCGLVFEGAWAQVKINWETTSAVMEASMGLFYASGVVFAVLAAPILLRDLWRLVSGQIADDDLMLIQESEEAPHADHGKNH